MMPIRIEFVVPGKCGTKGSFRHVGRGHLVNSAKGTAAWTAACQLIAVQKMAGRPLIQGPCRVKAMVGLRRPKDHFSTAGVIKQWAPRFPTKKPDLDKTLRAIKDALTGIVYVDDSQVVVVTIAKEWRNIEDTWICVEEM